jgi:MoaA/NifB/PqqE/SkfB family radical SAM enzyme
MNYNRFINPNPDTVDLDVTPICPRAKLDTGTHCNYNCYFCYYKEQLHIVTPLETIIQRADKLKELGAKEIDLSGGESSIHKDWFKILDYCNENFDNVSTLSNGFKFADYDFLKESQNHGLSEILFSLHGYDAESHDAIVQKKNAFNRMMTAIDNAKKLGIKVRLNCTVTNDNAPHLPEYTKMVKDISPFELNYLPLNYWSDNRNATPQDYSLLSEKIKESIDEINDDFIVRVRYVPFCYFTGYERYLYDHYQHIFDIWDWNICWYDYKECNTLTDYFKTAKEKINYTYHKPKECYSCQYFHICDGVEKQYFTGDNEFEVMPINSDKEKILDVTHFIQS